MILELVRIEYAEDGTFGIIKINGAIHCHCVELPWRNNVQDISCIPEGIYYCKRMLTSRGRGTFQVMDVAGRTGVLFDIANRAAELLGCIGIGIRFGKVNNERAVISSKTAMKNFMTALKPYNSFMLKITSC